MKVPKNTQIRTKDFSPLADPENPDSGATDIRPVFISDEMKRSYLDTR